MGDRPHRGLLVNPFVGQATWAGFVAHLVCSCLVVQDLAMGLGMPLKSFRFGLHVLDARGNKSSHDNWRLSNRRLAIVPLGRSRFPRDSY